MRALVSAKQDIQTAVGAASVHPVCYLRGVGGYAAFYFGCMGAAGVDRHIVSR